MLYQALYRKWRPRSFDDVISQPTLTTALLRQIKENRTAHAYLFTGSRGTGKTTCARIFAKAVNCLHPNDDGSPCLQCEICQDADRGALNDIIEIDAASNNSVDDVRDLREGTVYLPERCRYKIYIIDEVHMLSANAWGALLKVMEEPPEYVKFVLATTEVHKVPATIVSRCQSYSFRRIRTSDIAARLSYIASQENFSLDDDAAHLIAYLSDGGMRDALSLLDQCASIDNHITAVHVSQTAGVADRGAILELLSTILAGDAKKIITEIGKLYDNSKDMTQLCNELTEGLRNIMLLQSGIPKASDLLTCLPDEVETFSKLAADFSKETIFRDLSVLQDCRERIAHIPGKRVELEMTLLQLTAPAPIPQAAPQSTPAPIPQSVSAPSSISDNSDDWWDAILAEYAERYPGLAVCLNGATAFRKDDCICITVKNALSLKLFKKLENIAALSATIEQCLGRKYRVLARAEPQDKHPAPSVQQATPAPKNLRDDAANFGVEELRETAPF